MAKKKKTLEQKKMADLRHTFVHTDSLPVAYQTRRQETPEPLKVAPKTASLYPTSFLIHDLRKTGLLTLTIIAAQILLFLALKNHMFSISGLLY